MLSKPDLFCLKRIGPLEDILIKKQNNKNIPDSIDYKNISGLSNEVVEKLTQSKPETIGSASQIEGVTPAAINLILINIKKIEIKKVNA